MSNTVNQLLHNNRIMTTGIIVNTRPIYIKKDGVKKGIKYNLFIRTPHRAIVQNKKVHIYISLRGNWSRWHSYRILKDTRTPISIGGYKMAVRFAEWEYKDFSGNRGKENQFIILLKDEPPPSLICNKTIDEIFEDYDYYKVRKKKHRHI